jgi:hypothetical protein
MCPAHRYEAKDIKYSEELGKVYIRCELHTFTFDYTFMCKVSAAPFPVHHFFNMKTGKVLVTARNSLHELYSCYVLGFWVTDDLPVLSARIWDKDIYPDRFKEDFKEKYAAYLIDKAINS